MARAARSKKVETAEVAVPVLVDKIERRPVAKLLPYARNARTHTKAQIAQVAASIQQFGFVNPILIDAAGTIVAGHCRYDAAISLGMKEVPVLVLDHLSDEQRRAYVLADNKLAELAGWDDELLAIELGQLKDMDFDIGVIGFSDKEIDKLLGDVMDTGDDPGPAKAVDRVVVSKPGDVWELGASLLTCGKAGTEVVPDDIDGETLATMLVADPHFGMAYTAKHCDALIVRWQKATGGEAVHQETGNTFTQMLEERGASTG